MIKKNFTILASLLLSGGGAIADVGAEDLGGRLDLAVPQSAALSILGVSPDNVIEPRGGRELVAAALQGLDKNGNFQAGFGLELSLYEFFARRAESKTRISAKDAPVSGPTLISAKDEGLGSILLQGFRLGLASSEGLTQSDESTRYALSLNWSFLLSDYLERKAELACIKMAVNSVLDLSEDDLRSDRREAKIKEADKIIQQCRESGQKWTSTGISIGSAWTKVEDRSLQVNDGGYGVWMAISWAPVPDTLDVTAHFRRTEDQLTLTEGVLESADSLLAGARVRFGKASIRAISEVAWQYDRGGSRSNKFGTYSIGAEFKISKDLWFRLAYADAFRGKPDQEDVFSGQIRYAFGGEPLSSFYK